MFDWLPEVCREIRGHLLDIYWILLIPYCAFLIILEFFKMPEGNPSAGIVIKRAVVSMLLLFSFDECLNIVAVISDGVTQRIDGIAQLWNLLETLKDNYKNFEGSWLDFREAIIFILNLLAYIIAYLGVFVANALIQFVWGILYVVSPLMILMYVSEKTAFITSNLYKGVISVVVWKVFWSILGVMLLKLATAPQVGGFDNFVVSVIINLCIGLSMLFVPIATKSLINDGFNSAASMMAGIPAMATARTVAQFAKSTMQRTWNHTGRPAMDGAKNIAKRPFVSAAEAVRSRIEQRNRSDKAQARTHESQHGTKPQSGKNQSNRANQNVSKGKNEPRKT